MARKKEKSRGKRPLRGVRLFAAAALCYFVLGATLPLLYHKQPSQAVQAGFSAQDCYGEAPGPERVLCVEDNREALVWRLRLMEEAQREIILSTFDFGDDESGRDIMAALLAAARRGVRVRMTVDGANGMLKLSGSDCFNALIAHPNVEARFYNLPNPLKPWAMTLRLHDKYLIADDSLYLLGGRNTNDFFLGEYSDNPSLDRDLLVFQQGGGQGGSMEQLREYFAAVWSLPCQKEMTCRKDDAKTKQGTQALLDRYQQLKERYPEAFAPVDYRQITAPANRVTLLTNPPEPVNKRPDLWYMLNQLMGQGERVFIQTPYLICSGPMYRDLEKLCNQAQVQVMMNAVQSGANPWGCTDYLNQRYRIRRIGLELYEFAGEQSSHAKMILVDDRLSLIGSFNLDMRSAYLDTEMMLAVDCPQLNRQLRQGIELDKEQSRRVFPNGESEMGARYQPLDLPLGKKLFYGLLRILILPIRHLL